MIEHTYDVLEYHRLLTILSRHAASPLGHLDCLSRAPVSDATIIHNELELVSEMRLLLKVKGLPSLDDVDDVSPQLRKARAVGSHLEPEQLLAVQRLAHAYEQLREFLHSQSSLCPGLWGLLDDGPDMKGMVKELSTALDPNGSVKDNASASLKKIRARKARLRLELQKKLESIQRSRGIGGEGGDHLVTLREGRYVVPLRSDQKGRLEGIVHDFSQTRATCFVEPLEVIGDNNRLAELMQEEWEEELKVLARLTDRIREKSPELEMIQHTVGGVDGLCARAKFAERLSCVAPEIGTERRIHLKNAQNPILLDQALESGAPPSREGYPVPVDILLDSDQNMLIISGPNRGGKTVALKTLGLLSLMTQSGIHIPADEGSYLPVFGEIMAEIGDEQDIQSGFSTFSAHATHLGELLARANQRSLVIVDEPGMGTDPDEGAGLAMAVLDELSEKGATIGVATHLNRLKTYGLLHERAVNASVEFDGDRNRPTFRLQYGSPGISHALDIAGDMGIPSPVLERARGYLDKDEVHLNGLIQKLNRLMAEGEKAKEAAKAEQREYLESQRVLEVRLSQLEEEKRALLDAKRREAEEVIASAREEFRKLINALKVRKKTVQAAVTERMEQVRSGLLGQLETCNGAEHGTSGERLQPGRWVYHRKLRQRGRVESVDLSNHTARLTLGTIKIAAPIGDLQPVSGEDPPGPSERKASVSWSGPATLPRELNVVGYRVDDALPLIERAMDAALVKGDDSVRIIHGFGTGRLKQAIREHLRKFSFVKDVHSADSKTGGDAITVVELM